MELVKDEEQAVPDIGIEPTTARQLPVPSGWKILIAVPEVIETTDGGII